jgi:hypothetical protein
MKSLQEKSKVNPGYIKGLSGSEAAKRKKEIERGSKTDSDDPSAYDDDRFQTDFTSSGERKKTKPSKHTKAFKRMFGEMVDEFDDVLEEDFGSDGLLEEDIDFLIDLSLLREFIGEILNEKKKGSNVTTALKNKAEKSGAPMGALRAIYNKGLAAWRTGHRPGASPHQWAMARVNSVLAGGPARKVDAAQWEKIKKHRGKKRKKKKD